jgi:hypothetical protein
MTAQLHNPQGLTNLCITLNFCSHTNVGIRQAAETQPKQAPAARVLP